MQRHEIPSAIVETLTKPKRKRYYIPPKWPGTFENWSRQWVSRNYWKVRTYFGSKEDALAECAAIFARCLHHYAETIDNHAWFMALFKRAVANDWITFAHKDTLMRNMVLDAPDSAVAYPLGPTAARVLDASADTLAILQVIADAPPELIEFLFADRKPAIINRRLCRIAGITERDALQDIRNLLQ